jgi:hypothetical protein
MSFFSRLWNKLFGKKKEVQVLPVIVPSYPGIGKFTPPSYPNNLPPEYTVKENPVNMQANGWPVGASEFVPGAWYVPYEGQNGGPFSTPQEAIDWMHRVDVRRNNLNSGEAASKTEQIRGNIPVVSVSEYDAAFLYAANYVLQINKGSTAGNLFYNYGILDGTRQQIANLIGIGERLALQLNGGNFESFYAGYRGSMRDVVVPIMATFGL